MSSRPEVRGPEFVCVCVCVFRECITLLLARSGCTPLCIIYFVSLYPIALPVLHTHRHSVSVCGSCFLESGAYVLATCYPTTGSEQNTSLILRTHCSTSRETIQTGYVTVNQSDEYIWKTFLLPLTPWSEPPMVPPYFNTSMRKSVTSLVNLS